MTAELYINDNWRIREGRTELGFHYVIERLYPSRIEQFSAWEEIHDCETADEVIETMKSIGLGGVTQKALCRARWLIAARQCKGPASGHLGIR